MTKDYNFYQYGSAATIPEEIISEERRRNAKREEKRRKIHEQNARRRAHKRSLRQARLKFFSVTLSIAVVGSMLFCSVFLQNKVTESKKHIANLEDEITELNLINEATKSRIDTSVNLNFVKQRAIYELGMVYAGNENIVYYEIKDTDYMNKY